MRHPRRPEGAQATALPWRACGATALPWRAAGATWVLSLVLGSLGCSTAITLTSQGTDVRRLSDAELPLGCQVLSDVNIGTPPNAARPRTEDDLYILMRNGAGEHGGNVLVVDSTDQREEAGATHFVGRGRAYRCPDESSGGAAPIEEDDAAPPPPAEEEGESIADQPTDQGTKYEKRPERKRRTRPSGTGART